VNGAVDYVRERGRETNYGARGFKLRTGGLETSAFPPPDEIAQVIIRCRDAKVPFKATAGLHHALRRFDPGIGTTMHGFLNVFGAGILAHACHLNGEQVGMVLLEEDAKSFVFDDQAFRWRDFKATTAEVTNARKRLMTSFGSCSFDEPRDDLRSLGLLAGAQ
jgi:hypothetical protein